MDQTDITAWLAVLTGVLTITGTLYGYLSNLKHRRIDRSRRLNEAAAVAVRRTEGSLIRPMLRTRLHETVVEHASAMTRMRGPGIGDFPDDPLLVRMQLFVSLQRRMALTETEKNEAHRTAVSNLVAHLRLSPHSPISIKTTKDLERNSVRLSELIENAYNLRPRPGGEMIRSLAEFCLGTGVADVRSSPGAATSFHRPIPFEDTTPLPPQGTPIEFHLA